MASARIPLRAWPVGAGPVRSLYIHVPFCFHKCHYCDFYSLVDTRDRQEAFTERLCRELRALAPWAGGLPLRTVFVGGGTPSLLRVDLWERLLACLGSCFDVSGLGGGPGEFTVECNPETVSEALMGCLAKGGVNRVSVGAQSFQEKHLKRLERWHDPENVERAIELARSAGIGRQSLDLIFAIPGQTLEEWRADLERAIGIGTTHLSCYNLTYEPNTAMTARLGRGEFEPAPDELEADMYTLTLAMLRGAGMERYEVSNYAKPGDEARHNLAYWRQEQWLAAGPSASAHVGGHRWKSVPRLDDYLLGDDDGFAPIIDHEPADPRRAVVERLLTGLRLAEGVGARDLIGPGCDDAAIDRIQARLNGWAQSGHAETSGDRWRLTDPGFLIADTIIVDVIGALD